MKTYKMKNLIFISASIMLLFSCNKATDYKTLEEENKALKTDTMLQNKTIDRLFKEKDSLERIILLDSLKKE